VSVPLSSVIPVLPVERTVVDALLADAPDDHRRAVHDYVGRALQSMPEHLRLGVVAESLLLTVMIVVRGGNLHDDGAVHAELERWRRNRIGVIRQYVRMFHSLVTFADLELEDEIVVDLEHETIS
jgi:hypothetical protein